MIVSSSEYSMHFTFFFFFFFFFLLLLFYFNFLFIYLFFYLFFFFIIIIFLFFAFGVYCVRICTFVRNPDGIARRHGHYFQRSVIHHLKFEN